MKFQDLNNGLTVFEYEKPSTGEVIKFVLDADDTKKISENGPWYWRENSRTQDDRQGQLPMLSNRENITFPRLLMNPSETQIVYNVSRNEFDLRKMNFIITNRGHYRTQEFQKALRERLETNRESFQLVKDMLQDGQIFISENDVAVTSEKIQDQVRQPDPVKIRVLRDLTSDNIVLQFEDGTLKEMSVHEAKHLSQILQRLS